MSEAGKGLNFNTQKGYDDYCTAYDKSLELWNIEYAEQYIETSFGKSHVLLCGKEENPPLVLLHAASCGSVIWYKNIAALAEAYRIYAIDLIGEASKSILSSKMKAPGDNARWLDETMSGLNLDKVFLCGLSIGGWNAANYAGYYPKKVIKLILLSPVQTFAKMHTSYFFKIMKMGFHPTRANVENYIGWGGKKEDPLPDSIIDQFIISVMNMNANASFPTWLNKPHLKRIDMPVLLMLGEKEFAFSIHKAVRHAKATMQNVEIVIVDKASHLLPVSRADYINHKMVSFMGTI